MSYFAYVGVMDNIPHSDEYQEIIEDLYSFITNYEDPDDNLVDVVLEYCFRKDYTPEFIADVLSNDSSFKLALEINCTKNGTFRPEVKLKEGVPSLDEWSN